MATETVAAASSRPRPWLLIALFVVLGVFLLSRIFSGGGATPAVSSTPSPRQQGGGGQDAGPVDPADLDVRIEALGQPSPLPMDEARNPFRFRATPPALPRPQGVPKPVTQGPMAPPVDPGPPAGPPQPPPIGDTIKFIGIVETTAGKIGAFSDCRATFPGREGELLEGRYRVVRIGIESAVLEYLDGRGRATLPLNGSACVNK